jgi:hypothetical protein
MLGKSRLRGRGHKGAAEASGREAQEGQRARRSLERRHSGVDLSWQIDSLELSIDLSLTQHFSEGNRTCASPETLKGLLSAANFEALESSSCVVC